MTWKSVPQKGQTTWTAVPRGKTASEAMMSSTSEKVRDKIASQADATAKGYKKGGKVPGKGNKDTVPAKLTPGEFVVRKGPAKKHAGLLSKLNASGQTRFRST